MAIIEIGSIIYKQKCRKSAVICFALFLTFFLVAPINAYAQDHAILMLDGSKSAYSLAPYSYITIDKEKVLSPNTLVNRHNSNSRGKRSNTDLINLENTEDSIWILFSVYNKTRSDDWVLHFGNALDGRMGIIKSINILNHSTKQALTFPSSNPKVKSPFMGSALPLGISPGVKNTFIIQLEAQKGLPLVFKPTLIPQDTYMRTLQQGDTKSIIAAILFLSIISFFIASFYIGRNKASIALLSYYTVLSALFFNLDAYIVPDPIINGTILFWLYISSFILLVIASKFFSKLTYDHRPMENIALTVLTIFIIVSALLHSFVFGSGATGLIVLTSTVCLCLVFIVTITFFTHDKSFAIASLFCSGLLLSGAALILVTMTTLGFITPDYLPYFWFVHLIQATCFVAAYMRSNVHRKHRKKYESEHQIRDDQSLSRLQKSKDSADQARLLRVIERERELMSELREREIKRTEEMRLSKEIADRANQGKSAFLAVVSHEIRTPMNGIMGMVQLLQNTNLSKTQDDYVDIIRKSGDTMMALLNDILDFEKMERGGMDVETVNFDLRKLVQDIVILMSGHASQKNLSLNSEIQDNVPQIVSGDPTRLRQVILNLINNGLKFTKEGEVLIHIKMVSSGESKKVRFEIKDTGMGISEEAQKKLFTPFTQAESSISRKYGGTGLGLAISYRLIEAMGGTINIESSEGIGSTFFFDLDMESINTDFSNDADKFFDSDNTSVQKTRPMRILVTEDNEMNRKVLDGLLTQQGHTLFMAANGLEAIDICRRHQPELVLMDIQMDGLSGLETTKKIRADPDKAISSIPVIALTGNVMLEDIEEFFANGMNGFIAKPIDSNQLNDLLYNASMGKFENDISKNNIEEPTPDSSEDVGKLKTVNEIKKNENDTGIDLTSVRTDLSFDDREHYVTDSKIKVGRQSSGVQNMRDDNIKSDKRPNIEAKSQNLESPDTISATSSAPKEKPDFKRGTPDSEVTEIQRYLLQQHSSYDGDQDTNPHSNETDVKSNSSETQPEVDTEDLLDKEMLQSLIDTLGKEQFTNLLHGFLDKATEIIETIEEIIEEKNITSLGARAHELKGMAGNFGMKHVSQLAAHIEKNAKLSQNDDAIKNAKKLSAANDQTRAALLKWADQ